MNNIPIHAPLYTPNLIYGSNTCETLSALVEVDEAAVRDLLGATPFEYLAPYAWIEIVMLRDAFGVEPFGSGGVIVPARHPASETNGGYYAFCYIDTDEGLALGREPFGYPKKYAEVTLERNGDAARAHIRCDTATITLELSPDARNRPIAPPPRYPHLLLQVLPAAESEAVLLKRVLARDTGAESTFTEQVGSGAVHISAGRRGNELAWLSDSKPVALIYASGQFRSAYARVLETVEIAPELLRDVARLAVEASAP